ncbi:MAG: PD-(D/E)XK nuclease family transposase [Nitrospirae bacterium]|nr:PD-(D/E)XK nuclease family transposase [Nitrospirota bacterium]
MQFVDVRSDIAFKKIFGNEAKVVRHDGQKEKGILISFLNAVLDLTGDREIDDIVILNPYQAPRIIEASERFKELLINDVSFRREFERVFE